MARRSRQRSWCGAHDAPETAEVCLRGPDFTTRLELWGVISALALVVLLMLAIYGVARWARWIREGGRGKGMVLVDKKKLAEYHRMEALAKLGHEQMLETESFRSNGGEVVVLPVARDGDSLFAALAHQVYGEPVGSPDHQQDTVLLRNLAVRALRRDSEHYRQDLERAVGDRSPRYAGQGTADEAIEAFLEDLQEPGFAAGRESMRALADIARVDIVVYPDGRPPYEVRSASGSAMRITGISQRVVRNHEGHFHVQYDSVVDVKELP